jgi:hypothetical protein
MTISNLLNTEITANTALGKKHGGQSGFWGLSEKASHDQGLYATPKRDRARA